MRPRGAARPPKLPVSCLSSPERPGRPALEAVAGECGLFYGVAVSTAENGRQREGGCGGMCPSASPDPSRTKARFEGNAFDY